MIALRGRLAIGLALCGVLAAVPPSAVRAAQEPASAPATPANPAPTQKPAPTEKNGQGLAPALFDKKKPIEITSDRLDVDQEAKTAIFEGNVDAIQGEVHLKADRLKVYYEGDAAGAPSGATTQSQAPASAASPQAPATTVQQAASADAAASGGKIKRMDVDGKVFMSSPTETASGDKAVYTADNGLIVLTGNVILTRGQNVIRGSKLTIDSDSGHSVIDSKSSGGGGRVKGLFVPKAPASETASATTQNKPAQ
jgi:lipopolysaccharide export system protein LptA